MIHQTERYFLSGFDEQTNKSVIRLSTIEGDTLSGKGIHQVTILEASVKYKFGPTGKDEVLALYCSQFVDRQLEPVRSPLTGDTFHSANPCHPAVALIRKNSQAKKHSEEHVKFPHRPSFYILDCENLMFWIGQKNDLERKATLDLEPSVLSK